MGHLSNIKQCGAFAVLDTETSGLAENGGVIVQVSLTDDSGTCLYSHFVQLPKDRGMHPKAQAVHGITEAQLLTEGIPWPDAYVGLMLALHSARLDDRRLVIYNAPFDTDMIIATCEAHGISSIGFRELVATWPPLDAMLAYAEYEGNWNPYKAGWKWYKLTQACANLSIPVENAHDALGDCRMCAQVVKALRDQHDL